MLESGEITNDTEVVFELQSGSSLWKCEINRVIGYKLSPELESEVLVKNDMLKPEVLVFLAGKSLKI